jgi:membrane protein YdbS with pleckstrin-like domain
MQLDSRATVYFMFRKTLWWVIVAAWLALLFAPGASTAQPHPGIQWEPIYGMLWRTLPFLALLLAVDGLICYLRTRAYRIDLGPQGIALQMGVLSRSHETLIYAKIQDILIRRNVLERLLGLSSVTIQNAMGQPAYIPGLKASAAESLRDEILRRLPR